MVSSAKLLTVAIDGPAGAGKSTVSKALAKRLGLTLVDTGALYRSVALQAQQAGVAWEADEEATLGKIARTLDVRFDFDGGVNRVLLCGNDVSTAIRTPENSQGASKIATLPAVRAGLMDLQRTLANRQPGAVLEGRDIGTVVLPGASAKFFLTASLERRVKRRYDEVVAAGGATPDFEELLAAERERDLRDSERATAPLKQADDAILVDSSALSADEVVELMVQEISKRQSSSDASPPPGPGPALVIGA